MGKLKGLPIIGERYKLGKTDCFTLVLKYLEANGFDTPEHFECATRDNYIDLFKEDREEAIMLMVKFVTSMLKEMPLYTACPGDVLVLEGDFLGIEVGNAKLITACPESGTIVDNKTNYKVKKVLRWDGM